MIFDYSKLIRLWRLVVKVAGSNTPTAGQLPQLEAICWPRPLSGRMIYSVIQLTKEVKKIR